MSQSSIFIDGQTGTTGLQIRERLASHPHIKVMTIDHDKRRDPDARRAMMKQVDVTVLCLPDDAALESAALAAEVGCRVLDASTAHRIHPEWVYGFPEMTASQRAEIAQAPRVSNPGCYATGVIALLRPLIDQQLISPEQVWAINAISGYTGGGTAMIAEYQSNPTAFAGYAMGFNHKHIPEIQRWSRLQQRPIFQPAVVNCPQGMLVYIPVVHQNGVNGQQLHRAYQQHYQHQRFIQVHELNQMSSQTSPKLTTDGIQGSNRLEVHVFASADYPDRSLLVAKLDNLGKGASGAAVQNLNIMLGYDESLCTDLTN